MTNEELQARVQTLFGGRDDAYLKETSDGRGTCVKEALAPATWREHLEGRKRIGAYALVKEDREVIAAHGLTWDLDGKDLKRFPGGRAQALAVANALVNQCEALSLDAYTFVSRSNNGFHVRVFGRLPWRETQQLGQALAQAVAPDVGVLPEAIEVFPKGGVGVVYGSTPYAEYFGFLNGNMDTTVMVGSNGEPLEDQVDALFGIHPCTPADLRRALASLDPMTSGEGRVKDTRPVTPPGHWAAEAMGGVSTGSRHETAKRLAGHFRDRLPKATTQAVLRAFGRSCQPPLADKETDQLVEWTYNHAPKSGEEPGDGPRFLGPDELLHAEIELDRQLATRRVSTGFRLLDTALGGGMYPGQTTIVAARTGVGKTDFLLNIGYRAARFLDRCLLLFSLEVPAGWVVKRLRVRSPDGAEFVETLALLRVCDTPGLMVSTIGDTVARYREMEGDPALVAIDYLSLVRTGPEWDGRPKYERVGALSKELTSLARRLDLPILAAHQANRRGGHGDEGLALENLRDSGEIEEDATNVILLHRPEMGEANREDVADEDRHVLYARVAKARHGPGGLVRLYYDASLHRITELQLGGAHD